MIWAARIFIIFVLFVSLGAAIPTSAAPAPHTAFQRVWEWTDLPVAQLQVSRTWVWGPRSSSSALNEPFAGAPGGQRTVQYFDKSRMEINDPNGDPTSLWYVTNGLLGKELVTGNLQTGPDRFEPHDPATVNVSGDPSDAQAPTYASFSSRLKSPPLPSGSTITQTLDRAGNVGNDPSLTGQGVTVGSPVTETNHAVASVFWDFMTSSGLVAENEGTTTAPLFQDPFYATGFPISEAYWSRVLVEGVSEPVLIQVFERRVLTYNPANPDGWEVEAGNVGQHYYTWRHGPPVSVQLPVRFHAQQDPIWCDPADIQMWLELIGAPLPGDDDTSIQRAIWDYEISHNAGYTLDEWAASPYAVASALNHYAGRTDVGDLPFSDFEQAGIRISRSIAIDHQPVIALVDDGTHYILINGVVLGPGGASAPPIAVTVEDPWTQAPTRVGYPAMGQGTRLDWETFATRFTVDSSRDPGIWSGKWVLIASGIPLSR
ncbi:MAG TPA: hypothetical protein VFS96_00960 [Nitrolancea sp.]|nr:hypothetical protein [Nitrolancea sp.]